MDSQKTGAFIAMLRKEKNYTQKELAEMLHVSDKAVSRWETGKGYPETTLLKPLSDLLSISVGELLAGERMADASVKEQTDHVIVESLHRSDRKVTRSVWLAVSAVVLALLLGILWIAASLPREQSAMEFIHESSTRMLYDLAIDNNNPHTEYPDFSYREFDCGYEYYAPDGSERYVFTYLPEYADAPVMSYMHCSSEGSLLFGIAIGEETYVERNEVLGVQESYSLRQYLVENGFQQRYEEFQYGRRSLVYIDGERCNWYFYYKDNVFVNVLLSAHEGSRLLGYDIGLMEPELEAVLQQDIHGYRLTLEDPENLVKRDMEEVHLPGDAITFYARKPAEGETIYLYINGEMVGVFLPNDDPVWTYQITFRMLSQNATARVTSELPA